eukprot:3403647-Pleurochrysis_carterae.AAC.2
MPRYGLSRVRFWGSSIIDDQQDALILHAPRRAEQHATISFQHRRRDFIGCFMFRGFRRAKAASGHRARARASSGGAAPRCARD